MKRALWARAAGWILLVAPITAPAADMRVPVAVPVYVPVPFTWTEVYIGANTGGAWADGNLTSNLSGLTASTSRSGLIGGGQLGFNYQFSSIVVGAEWDVDRTWLDSTGNALIIPVFGTLQGEADTRWVSTLTGKFGVALDHVLVYGKGGAAWAGDKATITNLTTGVSLSASNTVSGWTAGGGVEWAFAPSLSAKLEYDFVGLQNWTLPVLTVFPPSARSFTMSRDIQMVKVGFNYRLSWDSWPNYWLRCGPGCF
jgi:opacity protein-like surface antigen